MVLDFFVFLVAGLVTGVVTGLVGASAIVAFVPIILLFLNMDILPLVGISLGVDAIVSLVAFWTYKKYGNIDIPLGIYLSVPAVLGTILGSHFSVFLPNQYLSMITGIFTCGTGIAIYLRKSNKGRKKFFLSNQSYNNKFFIALIISFFVGISAGIFGAAGGVSLLLLLVFILGLEMHMAIGTSVFIMFFIALTGSVSHFYNNSFSIPLLVVGAVGGIIGARYSAKFANSLSEKTLNKIVGIVLFIFGLIVIIKGLF